MKKPKLTPWFPADVKPVHVGWYDRDWGAWGETNDYWDGANWHFGSLGGKKTLQTEDNIGLKWRGLANPPKATGQCLKGEE